MVKIAQVDWDNAERHARAFWRKALASEKVDAGGDKKIVLTQAHYDAMRETIVAAHTHATATRLTLEREITQLRTELDRLKNPNADRTAQRAVEGEHA